MARKPIPKQYRRANKTVKLWTGFEELDKQLAQFEPKLSNKLARKAMRKAARPVLIAAKAKVPVDRGELKKSLVIKNLSRRRNKYELGARIMADPKKTNRKYYATFVHFGTAEQAPTPFLFQAIDETQSQVVAIFTDELNKYIEETARELGGAGG